MENVVFTLTADHGGQSVHYSTEIDSVETWVDFLGQAVFPALRAHTYIIPNDEDILCAIDEVLEGDRAEEIADLEGALQAEHEFQEALLKVCYNDRWPDGGCTFENYQKGILEAVLEQD